MAELQMAELPISASAASAANPGLVFGFLPNPPPPWLGYITAAIALGVLLMHIAKFVSERRSDTKKRLDDINDAFWFRSVVVPAVIEPLIAFITEQADELQKKNTGTKADYEAYLESFQKGKESISSRLILLNLVNKQMYNDAIAEFDEIEDDITLFCALKSGNIGLGESRMQKYTEVNSVVARLCGGLNLILEKIKSHHLNHLR